jgi:hypothetical protein
VWLSPEMFLTVLQTVAEECINGGQYFECNTVLRAFESYWIWYMAPVPYVLEAIIYCIIYLAIVRLCRTQYC